MGFRFRRRDKEGRRLGVDADDAGAIEQVLDEARALYNGGPDVDLHPLVIELFERKATADIKGLRDRGVSGEQFYRQEIAPNWNDLDRAERSEKIESFARFANAIATATDGDQNAAAGMAPVVRTKVVVLAWAFDSLYRGDYLERLVRSPERFGELEVTA